MLIQIYSYLVSKLKSSNESMRKTSKQHIWLDEIEAFLEKKNVVVSYSIKTQCSTINNPLLILFLSQDITI
jgi:hypothetical protein